MKEFSYDLMDKEINILETEIRNFIKCLDWLTYRSYEAQRINSPHIEYQRWGILFANVENLETIYRGLNKMELQYDRAENRRQFYHFLKCYEAAIDDIAECIGIDWNDAESILVNVLDKNIDYIDKYYQPLIA